MKKTKSPWFSIGVLAICLMGLSCTRSQSYRPYKTPPTKDWPSEIYAAADIIRTSTVNQAREDAFMTIADILDKWSRNTNRTDTALWQPLTLPTITNLIGHADTELSDALFYGLGESNGTASVVCFQAENGVVVHIGIGHAHLISKISDDHSNGTSQKPNKPQERTSQ